MVVPLEGEPQESCLHLFFSMPLPKAAGHGEPTDAQPIVWLLDKSWLILVVFVGGLVRGIRWQVLGMFDYIELSVTLQKEGFQDNRICQSVVQNCQAST